MSLALQFVTRAALIALLWIVISEGDVDSLRAGLLAAFLASAASLALQRERLLVPSPVGLARFVGFFLVQSVRGGIDVALRAIRPSMPIDPEIVSYRMRIAPTGVRVLFANTLSLLPGTLSAQLAEDELIVHVLDRNAPVMREIALVELRVAEVFGLQLPPMSEEAS